MRKYLPHFVIAALLAGGGWLYVDYQAREDAKAVERAERREARLAERTAEQQRMVDEVRMDSGNVMPSMLAGVELGMDLGSLKSVREAVVRSQSPGEPGEIMFEEVLPNQSKVLYGVSGTSERLIRVLVLSILPTPRAIAPHLAAMNAQYGAPRGIFNCPATGDVPTRRFVWRSETTSIQDIFLIHRHGISLTLYIAPHAVVAESLRRSGCRQITREEFDDFPIAENLGNAP